MKLESDPTATGAAAFRLLTLAEEKGFVKTHGRQRTDSTHVLAAVRVFNRLDRGGEIRRTTYPTLVLPG